ncbi:MAG TPA: hypothetical protein DD619_05240 [Alphaproteobacteria bacterium]|nr:hypothetical protein [Alphaproteobacteria bacterium]
MKRRNNKKTIMQQGGLMIEALAMLGLIAVVTPTMYKKSAERTMEVEDINSATTIRTIMNAANDYVGANYSTIISDMNKAEGDANKYRPITRAQIEPYLPYGFNMNKALYNYDFPELAIAKNDNNLTTFALFPAKANADNGIGQERTSRIASLVGASGGYVTESGKARGIGGIWKLEGDAFNKVFPTSGSGANEYSIVTASADTINAATGNEIDMDKYLQRGRDDPDDTSTLWKNTMRTDLYMGINKSDDDVYKNEAPNKVQDKLYSIRNIKSLIVGGEKANQDDSSDLPGYGLYIRGTDANGMSGNPNAFIQGYLRAAQEQFYVDDKKLGYGTLDDNFKFEIDKETGDTKTIGTLQAAQTQFYVTDTKLGYGNMEDGNFRVEMDKETGNTRIRGTLENDKNVALANSLGNWDTVTIGAVDRYPGRTDGNHAIIIKSSAANAPYGKLTLFDDDVMYVQNKGNNDSGTPDNDRIVMLKGGVKQLPDGTTVPTLSYNTDPTFPMRVGANAKFEGLVAAGQLDTQKIRAASLSVGSSKIDDANKWMTVDANGVLITNPIGRTIGDGTESSGTRININKDQIALSVDKDVKSVSDPRGRETSAHSGKIVLNNTGQDDAGSVVDSSMNIQADVTRIRANSDMRISGTNTLIQAGSQIPTDDNTKVDLPNNTLMLRNDSIQAKLADKSLTVGSRENTSVEFVNVGDMNTNAGVNIIALQDEKKTLVPPTDANKKVVTIEEGATSTNNHNSDSDAGTVYIRKGYVEVHGGNVASGTDKSGAFGGNGVLAASRFVANNSPYSGANGETIPEFLTTTGYDGSSKNRYDTYMVNPAYTSVMHDIKLTTRGGARLSDVLPDFINKGIYVVNNTILEKDVDGLDSIDTYAEAKSLMKDHSKETDVNLGSADAWASPFLGAVPAPQCPPGYGRVITLNPAGFQMGQAGSLHTSDASHDSEYYVAPYTPSTEQAKPDSEPTYDLVDIKSTAGDTKGSVTGQTTKYVLTASSSATESSQLATPLVFQQSTWLKSMVTSLKSGEYVQGWAAIMGFLYPGAQYQGFIGNTSKTVLKDDEKDVYWNLFPVARGTLEGYATVYCYFDRTNKVTGNFWKGTYEEYVDSYSYMQDIMGDDLPTGYEKVSGKNTKYQDRLNDPNLKYDEVW